MITTAEVYLWGTRIGIIHKDPDRPYVSFEYDAAFRKSGIELSPISMPLAGRVYEFPDLVNDAFHGMPGLVADSLPDKFGNAVIRKWLASQGRSDADFGAVDRLCYTGARGMGALEYVPATGPSAEPQERIDVAAMVRFASEVLNSRTAAVLTEEDTPTYSQLLRLGTSAGGARAKAIIAWNKETNEIRSGQVDAGAGFDYWLIKFDGVAGNGDHGLEDAPQYTMIEYAYYRMAQKAGIRMNTSCLYEENGRYHFMTKRFDRAEGRKLHMQTLGAIAHIDYNQPGLCSYEQASLYMRQMGLPGSDIEEFFRRMVFNVLAVNQDDHVKNVSFLMDRDGIWRLSPAYDITFAYDAANRWLASHQMTINGKTRAITTDDLLACGKRMGISSRKGRQILGEVAEATTLWLDIAADVGVREETAAAIQAMIRQAAVT